MDDLRYALPAIETKDESELVPNVPFLTMLWWVFLMGVKGSLKFVYMHL
jgi:hypothetical protein